MTICSIKKKKTFFTRTLFSEWIIEMDHHECTTCGGVGCFSTDQSEAELLYFCSLFFSAKKPFKKQNVYFGVGGWVGLGLG
jgi:hypothetical protein